LQNLDLVILAGGLGKRISFITKKTPKPLIKFGKLSFLNHIINFYAKYNFNKIYILAGYKGELIKKKFDGKKINLTPIECIVEKKLKGTAGTLLQLKKYKIKNFILVNGDSFFDIDLKKFIKNTKNYLIKMALVPNKIYKSNNLLSRIDVQNKKVIFRNNSKYMNGGIYLVNKKFIKLIKNKKSLEEDYLKDLINKKKVQGMKFNNFFIDIGTKKNLHKSNIILPKLFFKKAVFLDRDGVINYDYGYVHDNKNFILKKGVIKGLQYLTKKKINIFLITNQAGIAKNYYTEKQFLSFQKSINENFYNKNILINDIQYCPHHPIGKIKKYKIKCTCRKPNNKMILNIFKTHEINLKNSFMIGDKKIDQVCAKKSGLKFFYPKEDFYRLIKKII
jgi:D,D-heptose 1,7-bisphosphate phosphatase